MKHPPKVNVWWGICANVKIKPYIFTDILTSDLLQTIFTDNLLPPCQRQLTGGWHLLYDRDPKHTSKATTAWVTNHLPNPAILLPPNSPDLNPIENLISEVKRKVALKYPRTRSDLEKAIQDVTSMLPSSSIQTLCRSMDDRLRACIKAKGGHTDY